jgi:hypothetical protein
MTLPQIILAGDRRASLEAIRDHVAAELAVAGEQYVAGLARELRAVIAELDSLPGVREGSTSDDLVARRAARRAASRKPTAASQ